MASGKLSSLSVERAHRFGGPVRGWTAKNRMIRALIASLKIVNRSHIFSSSAPKFVSVSSGALRVKHCVVRVLQQRLRISAVMGVEPNPNTCGDQEAMLGD
jgi:hypothetical protein